MNKGGTVLQTRQTVNFFLFHLPRPVPIHSRREDFHSSAPSMAAHSLSSLPLSPSPSRSRCRLSNISSFNNPWNPNSDHLLIGPKLSLSVRPANSRQHIHKHRSSDSETASTALSIPEPEKVSTENSPRLSARAMKAIALAGMEARKLKHNKSGTDTLLMGILVEGTSLAAKVLREHGLTLDIMQQEIIKLLGKSSILYNPPIEPPMTEQCKWALDWAVEEKRKSGESGEVTTNHLLLGIWSIKESAGHKILAAYGFNDEKVKKLTKSINKEFNVSFKTKRKAIS